MKESKGRRVCRCECGGWVRGVRQFGRLFTWCEKCTPAVTIKGEEVVTGIGSTSGNASRFFYTAKADGDDRVGSAHPTIKPVDLMRWLVRLVTPPGGLVLDPFAGTGTTGEAAWREGFQALLIEREPEYAADIAERMRLALEGPDGRARTIQKRKQDRKGDEPDMGPLFGGSEAAE